MTLNALFRRRIPVRKDRVAFDNRVNACHVQSLDQRQGGLIDLGAADDKNFRVAGGEFHGGGHARCQQRAGPMYEPPA